MLDSIVKYLTENYDCDIESALSDKNLLKEYITYDAFKKRYTSLQNVLKKHISNETDITNILNEYTPELIPPGLKGNVRGTQFNKHVERLLKDKFADNEVYDVVCEKYPPIENCLHEIPDWYVFDKRTSKYIVGYNQIDLWSGGEQSNRGFKYVVDDKLHNDVIITVVSVICSKPRKLTDKSKIYHMFKVGIEKDRICFCKNLCSLIEKKLKHES
jgi:hypothetical protein